MSTPADQDGVGVLRPILLPIFSTESNIAAAVNEPARGAEPGVAGSNAITSTSAQISAFARVRNEFIEKCNGVICTTVEEGMSYGMDQTEAEEMLNVHAIWKEQEARLQRTMEDVRISGGLDSQESGGSGGSGGRSSSSLTGIDPHHVLVMTVPKHVLCPSACTLNEFTSTEDARGYKTLLLTLMYLAYNIFFYDYRLVGESASAGGFGADGPDDDLDNPFKAAEDAMKPGDAENKKRKRDKKETKINCSKLLDAAGNRRVRVFMEYIMGEDFDPARDRPSLISALGIRFHFCLFGDEINLIEGIENYMEDNGVVKMPVFAKRIRQGSPSTPKAMATPPEIPMTVSNANDWKNVMHGYIVSRKLSDAEVRPSASTNDEEDEDGSTDDVPSEAATARLDRVCDDDYADSTRLRENMRIVGRMGLPNRGHALAVERVLSLSNSHITGMSQAQRQSPHADWRSVASQNGGPAAYRFAFPSCVFEIRHPYTAPVAVLSYSLPYTFDWVDKRGISEIMEDSRRLQNHDLLFRRFARGNVVRRNDLRELQREIKEDLARVEKQFGCDNSGARAAAMQAFRTRSLRAFARVWSEHSMISDPTIAMLRYMRRNNLMRAMTQYGEDRCPTVMDPKLSWFGNMMAQLMDDFEFALQTSVTHKELLILFVACFDAYRYEMNLHLNVLMLGPGGKGKSRMLELVEDILIPDTCFAVTHSTRKANTSDDDNNDHISIFSEMPPHKMGLEVKGANGGGETGDAIEKERLTSCRVKTKTLYVDHDNMRRLTKTTESECVGVELGATNESFAKLGEAQFSRYLPIMINDYDRPGFNVVDKITALDMRREERKAAQADLKTRMRLLQYQCNMVNKLIFLGILPAVDESVPKTMFNTCFEYMRREGVIFGTQETTRAVKKLLMVARALTIMRACSKYFNDPRSPAFGLNGKFEIELHMGDQFAPLLFCDEEIAYFTMTLLKHTFINEHFVNVAQMIMKVFARDFIHAQGMDDELEVDDMGYCTTRGDIVTSIEAMAHRLHGAQSKSDGAVLLSRENIQGTLVEMRRTSLGGKPLLVHNRQVGSIAFLDIYRRKVIGFDASDVLHEVFQKSYAHKHMRRREKVISGCIVSKQHPFLFSTLSLEPNPDRVMTMLDQDAWHQAANNNNNSSSNSGDITLEVDFEQKQHEAFWEAQEQQLAPFSGWQCSTLEECLIGIPESYALSNGASTKRYPHDAVEAMQRLYHIASPF